MNANARRLSLGDSPYMTAAECAAYLKFPSIRAFYKWFESPDGQDLPSCRRGKRTLLFDRRVVDAYLRGDLPRSSAKAAKAAARRLTLVHAANSAGGDR